MDGHFLGVLEEKTQICVKFDENGLPFALFVFDSVGHLILNAFLLQILKKSLSEVVVMSCCQPF